MRHTVHVTVTYSVEVVDEGTRPMTKADILETAMNDYNDHNKFDAHAHIFESYSVPKKNVRVGKGSY